MRCSSVSYSKDAFKYVRTCLTADLEYPSSACSPMMNKLARELLDVIGKLPLGLALRHCGRTQRLLLPLACRSAEGVRDVDMESRPTLCLRAADRFSLIQPSGAVAPISV